MQWTKEIAEKMLIKFHIEDVPLVLYQPRHCKVAPGWFIKYKALCHNFMESLDDSIEEFAVMNLGQDEFVSLLMGKKMPENLSIRFRIPLFWGGELEIGNLFMCWTFPQSNNMDKFIIEQSGNDMIWLPDPVKKVYVPAHVANGGEGGNSAEDRLSQLAAQLAAQNTMS